MSYGVYCAECANGGGPWDDEDYAETWAEEHNADYHNEPDRDDADRDHYLDTLKEDR